MEKSGFIHDEDGEGQRGAAVQREARKCNGGEAVKPSNTAAAGHARSHKPTRTHTHSSSFIPLSRPSDPFSSGRCWSGGIWRLRLDTKVRGVITSPPPPLTIDTPKQTNTPCRPPAEVTVTLNRAQVSVLAVVIAVVSSHNRSSPSPSGLHSSPVDD